MMQNLMNKVLVDDWINAMDPFERNLNGAVALKVGWL